MINSKTNKTGRRVAIFTNFRISIVTLSVLVLLSHCGYLFADNNLMMYELTAPIQYSEAKVLQQDKSINAAEIANSAERSLPYRTEGGGCEKCDSVNILDVPQNPKNNSKEGAWLKNILSMQNTVIDNLFNKAGYQVIKTKENDICQGKLKCSALYRQHVIVEASEKL